MNFHHRTYHALRRAGQGPPRARTAAHRPPGIWHAAPSRSASPRHRARSPPAIAGVKAIVRSIRRGGKREQHASARRESSCRRIARAQRHALVPQFRLRHLNAQPDMVLRQSRRQRRHQRAGAARDAERRRHLSEAGESAAPAACAERSISTSPSEYCANAVSPSSSTSPAIIGCMSGQNQAGPRSKPSVGDGQNATAQTLARFEQTENPCPPPPAAARHKARSIRRRQ